MEMDRFNGRAKAEDRGAVALVLAHTAEHRAHGHRRNDAVVSLQRTQCKGKVLFAHVE